MRIRKLVGWILALVVVVIVSIQFVPADRNNPPVTGEITDAPAEVQAILERACYDCHSNETHWPWYSRVAPVSWLVAHDVEEGREHLNFSDWTRLDPAKREAVIEEIVEEVEEEKMPLGKYILLHSEARLSETDLAALRAWAGGHE